MSQSVIVYLLHYPRPGVHHGHYLGMAEAEASIRTDIIRHGAGWRSLAGLAPVPATIADVWDCATVAEAEALYARLKRQGSRRRICSVCSPGNSRGVGGRWAGHVAGTGAADR